LGYSFLETYIIFGIRASSSLSGTYHTPFPAYLGILNSNTNPNTNPFIQTSKMSSSMTMEEKLEAMAKQMHKISMVNQELKARNEYLRK